MILYKYASVSSALRILKDLRLKVALPNDCNDPFEFTPLSRTTLKRSEILQQIETNPKSFRPVYQEYLKKGFSRSFAEFLQAFPTHVEKTMFPGLKRFARARFAERDLKTPDEYSQFVGMLCLSAKRDSIPMWSHYGDHHRGVVIGVRPNPTAFSDGILRKVRYVKHRVSVDPLLAVGTQLARKQIERKAFRKSLEWKYEQEYRILFLLRNLARGNLKGGRVGYFVRLRKGTVASIIFGCFTPPKEEARLRRLLEARKEFSNIKILRAKRNPGRFALDIVSAACT